MTITTKYDYQVTIRNKVIKFRKWKVKDRKKFIKILNELDDINDFSTTKELVYDCLEDKNTILSSEEFRYVLGQIRKESVGDTIEVSLLCETCGEEYNSSLKIDDVIKPSGQDYTEVKFDDVSVSFGEVVNKEYYDKKLEESETPEEVYMNDFLYHISKIDGNETFTFAELEEYIDNMNIDVLDKVLDEWDKMRFTVNDVCSTQCSHCDTVETYSFDDLPGFFPETWFTRK